jgi:hypothetical protein
MNPVFWLAAAIIVRRSTRMQQEHGSSPAKIEASRRNALRSTGPTTPEGKARSSKNALRHGVYSALPVVPGLEWNEDWVTHRAGILKSLAPEGTLEEALAERVALCFWRLNRVHRYETAITSVGLERIEEQLRPRPPAVRMPFPGLEPPEEDLETLQPEEALGNILKELQEKRDTVEMWAGTHRLLEQLPELPDNAPVNGDDAYGVFEDLLGALPEEGEGADIEDSYFLTALGIPEDELDDAYRWHGWSAGMVRKGLAELAKSISIAQERLLAKALKRRRDIQEQNTDAVQRLEATLKVLRRRMKTKEDRLKRERMLPEASTLQKITRYEAHLSRQLLQALHELQRLQAARGGQAVPLPAALDVVVDGGSREDINGVFEAATGSVDE